MEEFMFLDSEGLFVKKSVQEKKRHGDIALEYMKKKSFPIVHVDIHELNGYPWGLELAHYHSTFVIQNSHPFAIIYIPSILSKEQKVWIEKFLLEELGIFEEQIFICDFTSDNMSTYSFFEVDILEKLRYCLKEKGTYLKSK